MPVSLRFKTFPEILAGQQARAIALGATDTDLLPGAPLETVMESSSLQDADQHVQMSRLLKLFNFSNCKGIDLDERAAEIGALLGINTLQRLQAAQSISFITVGGGIQTFQTTITVAIAQGSTSFVVEDADAFPTSGSVTIEIGTPRQENIVYVRSGDTFTVVNAGGTAYPHATGAFVNLTSTQSILASAVAAGATSISLSPGTGVSWNTSGSVILDRSLIIRETIPFTRVGDTLTLSSPTAFAHAMGSLAIQSTSGTDQTIGQGEISMVPPSVGSPEVDFTVQQPGVLYDGDYVSGLIQVQCTVVGSTTNVGSGQISAWKNGPPFSGATVTNPVPATGGRDRELDPAYLQRIKNFIQSLSNGTPLAIVTKIQNQTDPVSGSTVQFVQIVEPVSPGASTLYITDGTTTFTLGQIPFIGRATLISNATSGDARAKINAFGPFGVSSSSPTAPRLFVSIQRGNATSTGINFIEDTTQAFTPNAYAGMFVKTIDDQFYPITGNNTVRLFVTAGGTTPALGPYSIHNFGAAPLVPTVGFNFNQATGDVELATPLSQYDSLVAASDGASPGVGAYTYSTGLAAYAQRLVNGDPSDPIDFPGIRVAGSMVVIAAPTVVSSSFVVSITPLANFTLAQLSPLVMTAVLNYVNSLGIGATIIISEIVAGIMAIPGVYDCSVIAPTGNGSTPSGQLPRATDADVDVV